MVSRSAKTTVGIVLTALAAFAVISGSARAAVPNYFFGVEPASAPLSASEFSMMREAGIGTVRLTLDAAGVRRPGRRADWRRYDRLMTGVALGRLRPLGLIIRSTSYAGSRRDRAYSPLTRRGRARFRRFAAAAVRRYGPSGSFWSRHPVLPFAPVEDWEVWNEPSHGEFWPGRPSAAAYARLLRVTASAIRRVDRGVHIAVGGLPTFGSSRSEKFLAALYRQGVGKQFDAVAMHPYGPSPRSSIRTLEAARRVMDRNGDAAKPIWITELGWCTGGSMFLSTDPDGQARNLGDVFRALLAARRRLRVERTIWFSWRDLDAAGGAWYQHCGLFDAEGRAKPAWLALSVLARAATQGWFRLDGSE